MKDPYRICFTHGGDRITSFLLWTWGLARVSSTPGTNRVFYFIPVGSERKTDPIAFTQYFDLLSFTNLFPRFSTFKVFFTDFV